MSLYGVCLVLAVAITLIYVWSNRCNRADAGKEPVSQEGEVIGSLKFKYPI